MSHQGETTTIKTPPAWDGRNPRSPDSVNYGHECFQPDHRLEPPPIKVCDVPFCDKRCQPTPKFHNLNITCMRCEKFHCNDCSSQIWSGEWGGQVFYKPNLNFMGMIHEVFQCAFCRATFDQMRDPGDGHRVS